MSSGLSDMADFDLVASQQRCLRLRKRILEMSQKTQALHVGGAFSCLEMVETIYFGLMRNHNNGQSADTFILSKGHSAVAQYVVLEELGILSTHDLEGFCRVDGHLGTHPDYGTPGIEVSSGSLGHGLPIALGMAMADKVMGVDRVVYVVMSDGELQEGSVWESMMLAPSMGLTNLVGFVDLNDYQSFGPTSLIHPNFYPVHDKVAAFGWETVSLDGHNQQEVYDAVTHRKGDSPMMVIGSTTKGKGISYMENVAIWHYRSPSPEEYQVAMGELSE